MRTMVGWVDMVLSGLEADDEWFVRMWGWRVEEVKSWLVGKPRADVCRLYLWNMDVAALFYKVLAWRTYSPSCAVSTTCSPLTRRYPSSQVKKEVDLTAFSQPRVLSSSLSPPLSEILLAIWLTLR